MTNTSEARQSKYSAAEWQMRVDLAACYRLADMFGFSDIIWNHITAKIPATENFLINRFGLRHDEITASNLVTLDLNGKIIDAGSVAPTTKTSMSQAMSSIAQFTPRVRICIASCTVTQNTRLPYRHSRTA